MTGTTASGWPYVLPADHPKEFPTHSQALANMLEAKRVRVAFSRRTAGDVTLGASWVTIDPALDLVLPAVVGDVILAGVSAMAGAAASDTNWLHLEAGCIVAGVAQHYFGDGSATATGVRAWFSPPIKAGTTYHNIGIAGEHPYRVQASDLSGGLVTVRLYGRAQAASRQLIASAGSPTTFTAKNMGA